MAQTRNHRTNRRHRRQGYRKRRVGGCRRHAEVQRGLRLAPRRESPTVVALLPDELSFSAIRRYPSFRFTQYARYLRQTERHLRTLNSQGTCAQVTLFEPLPFRAYCGRESLDPDTVSSRRRYAVRAASVRSITYTGQPLSQLLQTLREHQDGHGTAPYVRWLGGTRDCLCREVGELRRAGEEASDPAVLALAQLLREAGPGDHQLVCTVTLPGEGGPESVSTVLHASDAGAGRVLLHEQQALAAAAVLAAAVTTQSPGGVVLRSRSDHAQVVRGWKLVSGWPQPLTAGEVFAAYCTHPGTGAPRAPEFGVEYLPGFDIPRPGPESP